MPRLKNVSFAPVTLVVLAIFVGQMAFPPTTAATTHSPAWADAFSAQWPDLNTTVAGSNMVTRLHGGLGYTAWNTVGSTAAGAMASGYAPDDAIWAMFGHGDPGYVTTYNSGTQTTTLYASSALPGAICSYPHACLSQFTWSQLHQIRLMAFVGCHTAQSAGGANLPSYAYNTLGVDSTIGFNDTVYVPQMQDWSDTFFNQLGYNGGQTVGYAANFAATWVYSIYGGYYGFNSYVVYGSGVKVDPPAYGS